MINFLSRILLQTSSNFSLQFVLKSSTKEAQEINTQHYYLIAACILMFLVVAVLLLYVLRRFNHKKQPFPSSKTLSSKWEIPILVIPLLLVAIFFYYSLGISQKISPGDKRSPDVIITGHQWWWQADYPAASATTANEIYLPANKDLLLQFQSADVIHSWWVPQFGRKMDLIPNEHNFLKVHIKNPGTYYGTCSEFCGDQHANMQIIIHALSDTDFNKWLSVLRQGAIPDSGSAIIEKGKRLFEEKTCSNCHSIKGTASNGINGPDLTHLGGRKTLLTGYLTNNIPNLEKWISHPQLIKPGSYMPDFALDDSSVYAITEYLSSLQ